MITFLIVATVIFASYLAIAIKLFGVPSSLSITYYLFKKKSEKLKYLFPLMCLIVGGSLMPYWLESSPENIQFLAFFACGGLLFVGAACAFMDELTDKVHYISAGICGLGTVLWLIFAGLWYIPVSMLVVATLLVFKDRKNALWWYEMALFGSVFIGLWIY